MGKIRFKFYLKNGRTVKSVSDLSEFCDIDEDGNYSYKMVLNDEEKDIKFTNVESFIEVLQVGIQDTLDRYYETKMNGGTITNEKIDTVFSFGDIIVPIESIDAIKLTPVEEFEISEENLIEVEEC